VIELEEDLQYNNPKRAYNLIKTLRKDFQPRQRNIRDKYDRILTDLNDVLARWKEYCTTTGMKTRTHQEMR